MAGLLFYGQTAQITTGTAVKTLLQIVAATNVRVKVAEFSISFNGTSNTATPIFVEIVRQTSAGTMTSLTLRKNNTNDDETLQTTAQHTATVEPTDGGDVPFSETVHPQTGYTWQSPFAREYIVPGGTRLGLRVTAAASVSALARFGAEE